MKRGRKDRGGFTIVELLIVIVVIAILAAISVVAYNGIQDRARESKIKTDVATIVKAIQLARESKSATLNGVTNSYATGGSCWAKATGTDLAALPVSDGCINGYMTTLTKIGNESGTNIVNMRDPWGRPYLIDENEGESGSCTKDTVAVFKYPFTTAYGVYASTPSNNVPLSGFSGC